MSSYPASSSSGNGGPYGMNTHHRLPPPPSLPHHHHDYYHNQAHHSGPSPSASTQPPPDRAHPPPAPGSATSTSTSKEHHPALSRNQACRTCRNRKVRCDARKPGCGACRKTAGVQGRDPDSVVCEYDADDAPGTTGGGGGGSRKRKANNSGGNANSNNNVSSAGSSASNGGRRASGSVSGDERHPRAGKRAAGTASNNNGANGSGKKVADLERTIAELENKLQHSAEHRHPAPPSISRNTSPSDTFTNAGAGVAAGSMDWNAVGAFPVGPLSSLFAAHPTSGASGRSVPGGSVAAPLPLPLPFSSSFSSNNDSQISKPVPPTTHSEPNNVPLVPLHSSPGSMPGLQPSHNSQHQHQQGDPSSSSSRPGTAQGTPQDAAMLVDLKDRRQSSTPLDFRIPESALGQAPLHAQQQQQQGAHTDPQTQYGPASVMSLLNGAPGPPQQHGSRFINGQEAASFASPKVGALQQNGNTTNDGEEQHAGSAPQRGVSGSSATSHHAHAGFPSGPTAPNNLDPANFPEPNGHHHHAEGSGGGGGSNGQSVSGGGGGGTLDDGEFFGIVWPHWPPSLPSPKLVYSLCDVFFGKRFLGEDLVNKHKFFANLALPPTNRDFPHTALIHAMCAVATKLVTHDAFGLDEESYWRSEASPTDYHAAQAKAHIDNAIIRGDKLFSVAQAIILVCFYSYTSARFVEVWLYCGLATRICSPLGLNHLESLLEDLPIRMFGLNQDEAALRKRSMAMVYAPKSEEEKQERAHTFWMAFTCDRLAAACTGWASSLAEEEVSTLLPKPVVTPGPIQPITQEEMDQLSLSSPTFFTSNSLPLVGAANLHYKSVVLLGRVCTYLRSAPWPVGPDIVRGLRAVQSSVGPKSTDQIPHTPEFKKLDALIVAFRLSFPKEYKNVLRKDHTGAVETNLISAHVIPHASTILLHEAFCKTEDDLAMQRCLTSARAILSIIYLLWGSSYDISLLQPFITFCWAVAGRTLVRELAFKQDREDELGVATLTQEINVILAAMTAFADRSPLGLVVATSLRSLLQDPQSCHPRNNGGLTAGCDHDCLPRPTPAGSASTMSPAAGGASASASTLHAASSGDETSPGTTQSFSSLLWDLEQSDVALGQNDNYKRMEFDLRSVLGPSYDDLLAMP